jgi:hypothetical protein
MTIVRLHPAAPAGGDGGRLEVAAILFGGLPGSMRRQN